MALVPFVSPDARKRSRANDDYVPRDLNSDFESPAPSSRRTPVNTMSAYKALKRVQREINRQDRIDMGMENLAQTAKLYEQKDSALRNAVLTGRMAKMQKLGGRGAYWGKELGGQIGAAAGRLSGFSGAERFGRGVGGWLGDKGSDFVSNRLNAIGRGAIQINSLINPEMPFRPVSSGADETGSITFGHRELVMPLITGAVANTFQTLYFNPINPGLSAPFPWLSQLAQYFEEYEMIQCYYEFKSFVTEGNTTASGEVIMATQYNPLNAAFSVAANMENYDFASSCKVTDSMLHGVECDPAKHAGASTEYIRTGAVPSGQDAKTYDLAVTQVAVTGCPANFYLGNLYVNYVVRLAKSKVVLPGANVGVNSGIFSCGFVGDSTRSIVDLMGFQSPTGVGTACTLANATGVTQVFDTSGGAALIQQNNYSNVACGSTFFFPPYISSGRYSMTFQMEQPLSAIPAGFGLTTQPTGTNCTVYGVVITGIASTGALIITWNVLINSPQGTTASVTWAAGITAGTQALSRSFKVVPLANSANNNNW